MDLETFVSQYWGKYLDMGGSANAQNQCVDLANGYLKYVLNHDIVLGTDAINFPSKLPDFDFVTLNPQAGDLVIWGAGLGIHGHIAVYLTGDENNFTSFDENFPIGSPCHKQNHNYKNVIGYLRKKDSMTPENIYFILEPVWRRLNKGYPVANKAAMMADCQNIADNYSKWAMDALIQKWIKNAGIMYSVDCEQTICDPSVVCEGLIDPKNCECGLQVKAEQDRIINNLVG